MLMGVMGWLPSFLCMAALVVLVTLPVLFFREPPHPLTVEERAAMQWWPTLLSFVKRPGIVQWLCIIVVFKLGDSFASGMTKPLLVDVGLSLKDVGLVSGVVAMLAAIVGALAGGWGVVSLGRRRALLVFGGLQGLSMLGFVWVAAAKPGLLAIGVIVSVEHFLSGMASVAIYTCMMDACRKSHAGTDYTLQASVYAAATGLVYLGSGFSADSFGYATHFAIAVALALLALLPVYFWKETHVR